MFITETLLAGVNFDWSMYTHEEKRWKINGNKLYEHIVWSGQLEEPLWAGWSIAAKLGSRSGQST